MKKDHVKVIREVGAIADTWLPIWKQYTHVPGMAVAMSHKGKLVYANGFGYADLEKKQKATPRTLFRVASISKTFTAVAVMQLAGKGLIKLEDPVSRYVPWFKAKNRKGNAAHITIEDLLSHSSGICRDGNTKHWGDGRFPKDLETSFNDAAITLKRGTSFKYSNYGYSILGELIARVSGVSYEEYVQRNILEPLGMRSTYADYETGLEPHATGYGRFIPGEPQKTFPHYKANAYAPATGYSSTAEDLLKLADALALGSETKVLSDASKKRMVKHEWDTGSRLKYAFGLDVFTVGSKKIYGHSGGFQGFALQFLFDPKEAVSVVVLTNVTNAASTSIALTLLEMIYHGVKMQKKDRAQNYRKYVGVYRNHWRDIACGVLGGSLIAFPATTETPLPALQVLVPSGKKDEFIVQTSFLFTAYEEPVQFTDMRNGKAHTLQTYLGDMKRV